MSSIAADLDECLRRLDPDAAARLEQAVRDVLALLPIPVPTAGPRTNPEQVTLAALASIAEPMGKLTNEEIDRAVYGA